MPNEVKLLPCPFCGGAVKLERTLDKKAWGVVCRSGLGLGGTCAVEIVPSVFKEAAIERWNHRPTTVVTDEVVEPLKALDFDEPDAFERWWQTYEHKNRELANYSTKKCIAFDAFHEALQLARAALASMPTVVTGEQPGWLPIESAPKDREILLLMPNHGRGGSPKPWVTLGSYLDNSKTQWPWQGWKSSGRGPVSPTHWQPLPEPPAQPGDA